MLKWQFNHSDFSTELQLTILRVQSESFKYSKRFVINVFTCSVFYLAKIGNFYRNWSTKWFRKCSKFCAVSSVLFWSQTWFYAVFMFCRMCVCHIDLNCFVYNPFWFSQSNRMSTFFWCHRFSFTQTQLYNLLSLWTHINTYIKPQLSLFRSMVFLSDPKTTTTTNIDIIYMHVCLCI